MSFEEFINGNQDLIHKLSHKYSIKGYEHDDMYQEGLTKLFEVFGEFDDDYSETTFITTVLKNHFLDLIRNSRNQYNQNYDSNGNMLCDVRDFDFDILEYKTSVVDDIFDEMVLDIAFDVLQDEYYKDGFIKRLYGETLQTIGDIYGVSRQNIDQRFQIYLEKVRDKVAKELGFTYNNNGE